MIRIWVACILCLPQVACNHHPDLEHERNQILALLQQDRKAHFEKNVGLFMSSFSDSMVSVNRGIVRMASKEETRHRIQNYFNSVEFLKWDDVAAPKISFSEDGTMAYAIVQKQVVLLIKDSLEKQSRDTTDFAWVSIYRKTKNGWKGECNASTNK